MAESQPEGGQRLHRGTKRNWMLSRRKILLSIGLLLSIVLVSVAAILSMLHRLEARSATFQPPMTDLELQRILPQDPVLDAAPQLDGLHYRQHIDLKADGYLPADQQSSDARAPLSHVLILQSGNLRAESPSPLRPASQTQ